MHPNTHTDVHSKYKAMQAVSGSAFVASLICSLAAHYILKPSLVFATGSLIAGVLIYLAWMSAMRGRALQTATSAALAVIVGLGSTFRELDSSLEVILAGGLSHLGVSLFGLTAFTRRQQSASHR